MALAALAVAGAAVYNARRKRAAQIDPIEDGASYLPSTQPEAEAKLYDPLRRGPRWATDWLANRALHFRKRWPQPYVRPPYDNGQTRVLVRGTVGPEAAQRMQAVYADTLPEGPVFFTRKTTSFDRQIQPFVMPSYHPGTDPVPPCFANSRRPHRRRRVREGIQQATDALRLSWPRGCLNAPLPLPRVPRLVRMAEPTRLSPAALLPVLDPAVSAAACRFCATLYPSADHRNAHEAAAHVGCGRCGCVFGSRARLTLHTCPGAAFLGARAVRSRWLEFDLL